MFAAPTTAAEKTDQQQTNWTVKRLGIVAEFFNVELQTVKQWRTGANPMPGKPGAWPLDQIAQWRVERARRNSTGSNTELERRQLEVAIARAELKLRNESGELVSREAAIAAQSQQNHAIGQRLEAIAGEVAADLPNDLRDDKRRDWQRAIRLILLEMSNGNFTTKGFPQ